MLDSQLLEELSPQAGDHRFSASADDLERRWFARRGQRHHGPELLDDVREPEGRIDEPCPDHLLERDRGRRGKVGGPGFAELGIADLAEAPLDRPSGPALRAVGWFGHGPNGSRSR